MADNLPVESTQGPAESPALTAWDGALPEPASDDPGINWRRYVAALLRYKWLVLGVAVLGSLGGALAIRMLPQTYAAQATIWVESGDASNDSRGPIQQSQLLTQAAWVELARQFVVLDAVVQDMKLFVVTKSPSDSLAISTFGLQDRFRPGDYVLEVGPDGQAFRLMSADGAVVQEGATGDSVGPAVGFAWVPPADAMRPGTKIEFTVVTPRDAAVRLSQDLSVRIDVKGTFLRMELQGTEPSLIAATVNATAERFVDVARDLKRAKLTELTEILETQLEYAEERLHQAEIELERFRVSTITLPSDRAAISPGLQVTRDPVFTRYFNTRVEREQLRRDREALERAIGQVRDSGLSVDALLVIPSVASSAELSQALGEVTSAQAELRDLRRRYTEENPEVRRLASELNDLELRTVPNLARALLGEIRVREREYDRQLTAAASEMQQIPVRTIEEARLERNVAIAGDLYTNLQQRYEEARLAEASSIPDVRILDRAITPRRPVRTQGLRYLFMAFAGSLGLGLVGAVLLDRIDRRVRYPEQVSHELGLTILGAIPHVKGLGNGVGSDDMLPVVESLRGVRLSLTHAYGAAGPLLVTVSSPGSGDGKSFLTANLALAFSDAGHRTLVIDGDLRRGEQHQLLGARRKPGLTDYLKGDVPRDRLVQSTPYPALFFIGGGTRMHSAPELLGSAAMSELMLSLRSAFSVIIVDSPPLSVGVDPFMLSTATGNLLLVLRTGVTDRELASAKLDMLDRLPVRVLGAVLNDVRATGQYRYYGYQYYTTSEYQLQDEAAGGGARTLPGALEESV